MPLIVKQISSLEKVRFDDPLEYAEITEKKGASGRLLLNLIFGHHFEAGGQWPPLH